MAVVLRRRRRAARPNHDQLAHGRRSLCRSPTTSHRTSVEVESGRVQGDRHRRVGRVRHVSGFFEPAVNEASLLFSVVVRRIGSSIWRIQGCRTDVRFSDFRIVLRCTGVGGPGCAHLKGSSERPFVRCNRVLTVRPHRERLLFAEVGRRTGIAKPTRDPDGVTKGANVAEAAVFGLLGRFIAFTFSGAASRFEDRR